MPATTPVCSTFGPFEFDQNDGLPRPQEIGHHADDFQVEFLDLVTGENGVRIALHSRSHLAKRQDLVRLGGNSEGYAEAKPQGQSKNSQRLDNSHGKIAGWAALRDKGRRSRVHGGFMILGEVRGSN